ncbi:MAG TPA: 1-(5-phosphoribosyl)-5-amino-4-imidazole-carboxylate carboxylase, partial [Alloacidobacterium sp.]|nr:1-(5-phosphoribosyl)-5-amino-4-imidazole-carboxylate carboxylase [Alloacidobacterium sp.]
MTRDAILALLKQVETGSASSAEALEKLSHLPFEDAGFAKIDHHRSLRLGLPEVIYAAGKTPEQVAEIFSRMALAGGDVIATRASVAAWDAVKQMVPEAEYHTEARVIGLRQTGASPSAGPLAVLCAGTSDIPVAEEAAV